MRDHQVGMSCIAEASCSVDRLTTSAAAVKCPLESIECATERIEEASTMGSSACSAALNPRSAAIHAISVSPILARVAAAAWKLRASIR
jgi:hypothetical protein